MNTLEKICADKRQHIVSRKSQMPESALHGLVKQAGKPRGFKNALDKKLAAKQFGLIAEIKKASPSKGLIRADFHPASLAKAYEAGGAACLSVLTDVPYFQGDDSYISQACNAASLPVLRKDFILDPYQIVESRALGADCILLIIAALSDAQASDLEKAAFSLGMDVLVEVHDERELEQALSGLKSTIIGINNRDLKTMNVDLATAERLAKHIPAHILKVCESGISTHADLERMDRAGIHCFLVGESLMRETDVTEATRKLLG